VAIGGRILANRNFPRPGVSRLATVRFARLLPLTAVAALLALPASAMAAEKSVTVGDDFYGTDPVATFYTVHINPGDTVAWHWANTSDPHTVTSSPSNLITSFRTGQHTGNFTFRRTFPHAGRFTYHCQVHPDFMRGAVEVGPGPPFADSTFPVLRRLSAHPRSHRVKLVFRLSERSRVKVVLRGPRDKTFSRVRGRGRRSITIRHLPIGNYSVKLRPRDAAGHRGRRKSKHFTVSS
jgi:plastocyanin